MNAWARRILWGLFLCVSAVPLRAHPFLQDSWWVVVETNRLVMRVSSTLREVAVAQGLGNSTNVVALDRILNSLTNHGEYLVRSLQIDADGRPLHGEVLDFQLLSDGADAAPPGSAVFLDQSHALFDLEYSLPPGGPPSELKFGHRTLTESPYAPGIPWEVTYALLIKDTDRHDLGAGLVRADLPYSLELTPHDTNAPGGKSARVPESLRQFEAGTTLPSFGSYLRLGIWHILTGYDHLLFLAALALAARTLGDFLKLILTFTLAHSITVTLAALNLVRAPAWFVEPFIAGTIVFVAVENILAPRRVSAPSRLALAFGFGLIHGLGFARGLSESLGTVGGAGIALAIVAFCLGVELGHLGVGLPFWGALRAGRRQWGEAFSDRALKWGSRIVALGGLYFLVAALRQYS